MTQNPTEASVDVLARSLPIVASHQEEMTAQMEVMLRSVAGSAGRSRALAAALTDFLIGQGRRLVDTGHLGDLDPVARDHEALGVDGRHYSRFGDALIPVMKDVMGPHLPANVPTVWCDLFWAMVGQLRPMAALADA